MRKFLSALSLILIPVCTLSCLVSCKKDEKGGDDIVAFDISEYKIVRPENAGDDLCIASTTLKNKIKESTKAELTLEGDWYQEGIDIGSVKEILVGETNREETKALKAKLDAVNNDMAYAIEVNKNKIVILGKSEETTIHAIKCFVTNFVSTSQKEGTIAIESNFSNAYTANKNMTILPENLVGFTMSQQYTVYTPNAGRGDTATYQYPTAVYLQHQANAENNGVILATLNSSESFYRILRSDDDGETWKSVAEVFDTNPANLGTESLQAGRMPYLYELPTKVGEFEAGTIFLAGTSSPVKGNSAQYERTAITMYYSTDIGKTWTALPSVDYGKGAIDGNGVWEPFLIYEEETGRVYCFYSDATQDAVEGQHDQRLVYKYSTDMKNWTGETGTGSYTEPFEAIASSNCKHRPGMIAISKMTNGEYILTYEFVGSKVDPTGSTTFYKTTTRLDDWGDPADMGYVVQTDKGETSGSGPWSAYTPVGGENGIFFVFARFRGDYRNGNYAQPDIFISFDYGRTYTSLENPFKYTHIGNTSEDRTGYSVMFLVSPDGRTVYFFNNPPYGNTSQTISMVRIEITP